MSLKLIYGFLLVTLHAVSIGNVSSASGYLILWNVGQGQWLTIAKSDSCHHFDSGGEFAPPKKRLDFFCRHKKNLHYLSHYDWDHRSFLFWLKRRFPNLCRYEAPLGQHKAKTKYQQLIVCHKYLNQLQRLYPNHNIANRRSNSNSQVFLWKQILIAGDSTKKEEFKWANNMLRDVKILILGHHGSKTSTSDHLLMHMPELAVALVSSREQKYGHPHLVVKNRLKKKLVPVLSTEKWGTLVLEVPHN